MNQQISQQAASVLAQLNLGDLAGELDIFSPIDGSRLGSASMDSTSDVDVKIENAERAFQIWRSVPAPRRGELIRLFGEELRQSKEVLLPNLRTS